MSEAIIILITFAILSVITIYLLYCNLRKIAESLESIEYNLQRENYKHFDKLKKANYEMQGIIEDQRKKIITLEHK